MRQTIRLTLAGAAGAFSTYLMTWLAATGLTTDAVGYGTTIIVITLGAALGTVSPAGHRIGGVAIMLLCTVAGAMVGHISGNGMAERKHAEITAAYPFGRITGRAAAVTGNTLEIDGTPVRLAGLADMTVDATCTNDDGATWPCGAVALARLTALTAGRRTTCRFHSTAIPRVGTCEADGIDLGARLVQEGLDGPTAPK